MEDVGAVIVNLSIFVITTVLIPYTIAYVERRLRQEQKERKLSWLENIALEAVRYAEILDVNGKLAEVGMDKKDKALQRVEKRAKTYGINLEFDDIDEAVELAWERQFKNNEQDLIYDL